MNFPAAIQSGFRNFANFKGRASRAEFWWWTLFSFLAQTLTSGIEENVGSLVSLALLLPSIAVQVRRVHDVGRSGWWVLWPVVSIIVAVAAFVAFAVSTGLDLADPEAWDPQTTLDGSSSITLFVIGVALLAAIITGIINFVFTLKKSDPEMNRFGPPPPPAALT